MGWSSQREKARDGGWAGGGACGGGVDTGSCSRVQTLGGKVAADGPYEKRQMLWKEVTGRSWSGLVSGAAVGSAGGGVSPAAGVECSVDHDGLEGCQWTSIGRAALEGVNRAAYMIGCILAGHMFPGSELPISKCTSTENKARGVTQNSSHIC